ncbi:serine O-acetyltransferase [Methylobacillus caricis]|uniref:serine O-acetyltransferase n=1 Tax=Methylobacillus caricis TaxID=1971611 RepID=UPI001CFF66EC|nr:serine O-acetyltransferase [Methylobacillus caricis]MCB5188073.1 serine O-acetyltransferase [Methylobacillus caricis]
MNFFQQFLDDKKVYREGFLAQGFWALQIYRFGHLRYQYKSKLIRVLLGVIHLFLHKMCEIFFGISIGVNADIGQRFNIEHFGAIIIHGNCIIGHDCIVRQGVTLGNRHHEKPYDAPKIGNNVSIGAGAKLLGAITIGDNVSIGANAVVLIDVPDNAIAVGIPAKIITKNF